MSLTFMLKFAVAGDLGFCMLHRFGWRHRAEASSLESRGQFAIACCRSSSDVDEFEVALGPTVYLTVLALLHFVPEPGHDLAHAPPMDMLRHEHRITGGSRLAWQFRTGMESRRIGEGRLTSPFETILNHTVDQIETRIDQVNGQASSGI